MAIEYQRSGNRNARGTGQGVSAIVVLTVLACGVLMSYGVVGKFTDVISLLRLG